MLILARKLEESLMIGDGIEVKIVAVQGSGDQATVRIGIVAPRDVRIWRKEVYDQVVAENRQAVAGAGVAAGAGAGAAGAGAAAAAAGAAGAGAAAAAAGAAGAGAAAGPPVQPAGGLGGLVLRPEAPREDG